MMSRLSQLSQTMLSSKIRVVISEQAMFTLRSNGLPTACMNVNLITAFDFYK